MIKKVIVLILFFSIFILPFFVNAQPSSAVSVEDMSFISSGNRVYSIENGEVIWTYYDESNIVGMVSAKDWNSDGKEDIVLYSNSVIMPEIKILNGNDGEILNSFYPMEKTYAGNRLMPVSVLKLIDSDIFFSSGSLLYRIQKGQNSIERIFVSSDGAIKSINAINGKVEVNVGFRPEKIYTLDFNGNVLGTKTINQNNAEWDKSDFIKQVQNTINCPLNKISISGTNNYFVENPSTVSVSGLEKLVENPSTVSVSGLEKQINMIYCDESAVYYLNDSIFLFKRNLDTGVDTILWKVDCLLQDSEKKVFGQIVGCGNTVFVQDGKGISLPDFDNLFKSYYDGQKELFIENVWPFKYQYNGNQGYFDYKILERSLIKDVSSELDFFGDGNKQVFISFVDPSSFGGSLALLVFEPLTGKKQLLTLSLTENETKIKKNSLQNQMENLNDSFNQINQQISNLYGLINSETNQSRIDGLNSQINNLTFQTGDLQNQIWSLQNELNLFDFGQNLLINSFDVCDNKMFVTSTSNSIYYFQPGKNATKMTLSDDTIYPMALACLDKTDSKQKLIVFNMGGDKSKSYVIKESGDLVNQDSFGGNESLLNFPSALNLRDGNKVYLPTHSFSGKSNYYIFGQDGGKISEQSISINNYHYTVKSGKQFLCSINDQSDKNGMTIQAYLTDKGFSYFRQDLSTHLDQALCENMPVTDCNNDGKLDIFLAFKDDGKIKNGCLQNGGNSLNFDFEDKGNGGFSQPVFLTGRIAGNYLISEHSFIYNPYIGGDSSIAEPNFPYEVYTFDGKKIFVSLKSFFLNDGNFVDDENKNIPSKNLIGSKKISKNQVLMDLTQAGDNIIFVDGQYYDSTKQNQILLRLTPGEHTIKTYLYDGKYYFFDESIVNVPGSGSISIFSIILLVVFILIILIWGIRLFRER